MTSGIRQRFSCFHGSMRRFYFVVFLFLFELRMRLQIFFRFQDKGQVYSVLRRFLLAFHHIRCCDNKSTIPGLKPRCSPYFHPYGLRKGDYLDFEGKQMQQAGAHLPFSAFHLGIKKRFCILCFRSIVGVLGFLHNVRKCYGLRLHHLLHKDLQNLEPVSIMP